MQKLNSNILGSTQYPDSIQTHFISTKMQAFSRALFFYCANKKQLYVSCFQKNCKVLIHKIYLRIRVLTIVNLLIFTFPMKNDSQFGKKRLDDFYVDKTYTNLNHGSYGYTPKVVYQYKRQLEEKMQFNTEAWFRKDSEILINQTRQYVAKRVNCSQQNIFMVQNATDAFNGLMKSLHWKTGDVILLPNTAYASIRKTCQWLKDYWAIQILDVNFTLEDLKTPESIQLKLEDTANQFPKKIKCAVIDHISSMPSIVFPIHTIQMFLEEKGIDLFIDGAHSMSQVQIDIANLGCEAYFSNFHKWTFVPKNAAFIYISDKYLKDVRPAITGNFRGEGIAREYFWTGTRDCTSYLCVQKGVQYLESFGKNEVHNYNHKIVIQGARVMSQIWKTLMISSDERSIGYMACVLFPTNDQKICAQIQDQLNTKHNIYLVVGKFDGRMFTRLSGQIYNEIEDYRRTAELFLEILHKKQKNSK